MARIASCIRAAADFDVTGRLEAAQWLQAEPVVLESDWTGREKHPALATFVACLWTPRFLYFGFRCPYESLTLSENGSPRRITDLYERDVVEVFLGDDLRVSHYKEFEVSPDGHWLDLDIDWQNGGPRWDWSSGNEVAAHIDREHRVWTAELKVPVACLFRQPAAGDTWPVNFYRIEGRERRIYLAWSPTGTPEPNYHVPEQFGRLQFVG